MFKVFRYLNFNIFFIICCYLILGNVEAKEIKLKSLYQINKYIKDIKEKEIMNSLRMIVYKGEPNRFFGTSGHKNVQDLLLKTLKSFNHEKSSSVSVDDFKLDTKIGNYFYQQNFDSKIVPIFKKDSKEYQKWFNFKNYMQNLLLQKKDILGKNLIWSKKGESDKTLVITAHYDTVSHNPDTMIINENSNMPGADYNASSISILLGLVKLLNPIKLKYSIQIVFLDAQSLGFLGSYDFAKKLKINRNNIMGVINLEMLGHDSKHFDKLKKLNNFKVYGRDENKDIDGNDLKLYQSFSKLGNRGNSGIRFDFLRNNFNSSDNFRFWEQGFASVTFTQNWEDDFNKKYQTANDFPETINQRTLFHAFKYLARSTLGVVLDIKK
jgi:hypothetical protein